MDVALGDAVALAALAELLDSATSEAFSNLKIPAILFPEEL